MDLFQQRFIQSQPTWHSNRSMNNNCQPDYNIPYSFQQFAITDDDPHTVWREFLYANGLPGHDYDDPESDLEDQHTDFEPLSVDETMIHTNQLTDASRSTTVVQSLPPVILSEEDVQINTNAFCSVCMDAIKVGQEAKQLPCSHRYHGECITPWLEIKNTCPLCRSELT